MKRLLYIFLLVILAAGLPSYAQTAKTDSLLALLKTDREDTNKVIHLNTLCWQYLNIGEYHKALTYGKQGLHLAQALGWASGAAVSYNNLGIIHYSLGNYPEALKSYFTALEIQEELKDKKGIANAYNNIGNIYLAQENYPEALKKYAAALKIQEEIKDKRGVAASYGNIGVTYINQGDYTKALKNYFDCLKISEETGDKITIAFSYNGIGIIYDQQGNYTGALKMYFASLKVEEEIGNKSGIAICCINLGELYSTLKKPKEAKNYLDKALRLSMETDDKDGIKNSYSALAALDSLTGNYKAAFEHHKLYIAYRDSINNEETRKKSLQESLQYEFDKKEIAAKAAQDLRDKIQEEEKQRQKLFLMLISCMLALAAVFAVLMYRRFKITQKQSEIISHQKHLVEAHQKEIIDSINYAERIQRSFMATKEVLDANLPEYFVFFKPKDIVSGDFYWAATLSNGNFALVTADSTGHGVPGAIMSLLNVSSLEKAVERFTQPADILNDTRRTIIARLKKDGTPEGGKDGMDGSLTIYDFTAKKLWVAAANNPVWIVRSSSLRGGTTKQPLDGITSPLAGARNDEKEVIEIKPDKMPVGKHDKQDVSFTQKEIQLQKGDIVYTLTDGFPDQFGGEKGKKFMNKNLRELLAANAHLPMQQQKEQLAQTFRNWIGNYEQVDDVTLIGVRI